jgi:hypothetical protein
VFVCRVYVLLLERKNKADGFVVHDVVKKAESLVLGPHGGKQIVLLVSNEYWKTPAPSRVNSCVNPMLWVRAT